MGNSETLGRGCVQYMSAGKGVVHSGKDCYAAVEAAMLLLLVLLLLPGLYLVLVLVLTGTHLAAPTCTLAMISASLPSCNLL